MAEDPFLFLGCGCVTPGTSWAGESVDMGNGGGSFGDLGQPPCLEETQHTFRGIVDTMLPPSTPFSS